MSLFCCALTNLIVFVFSPIQKSGTRASARAASARARKNASEVPPEELEQPDEISAVVAAVARKRNAADALYTQALDDDDDLMVAVNTLSKPSCDLVDSSDDEEETNIYGSIRKLASKSPQRQVDPDSDDE